MARGLIAPAVLLVAFVVGCAEPGPPTLADGSVEAALPASIWPDGPALVTDVACADLDIGIVAQATTCAATLDTEEITVDVVVDEFGAATAAVRETLFVVAEAADQLVARLRDDLSIEAIRAECAVVAVIATPGRSFDCAATSGGRTIDFEIVLGRDVDEWTLRLGG